MINLDDMSHDELFEFWNFYRFATWKDAMRIFPTRPKGYVRAVKDCANYAINKAVAMKCRKDGEISKAKLYEDICDNIYNMLPDFAKW